MGGPAGDLELRAFEDFTTFFITWVQSKDTWVLCRDLWWAISPFVVGSRNFCCGLGGNFYAGSGLFSVRSR